MALNSVTFACTSLVGVNKVGELKKNAKGYYPMVVGALNVFNSAGQLYVYEQAKDLFESSSQFQRRVARGSLRGENGHPRMDPNQSVESFANRVMTIVENRICCHHASITLDYNNIKDANGKPVIAIISEVCPSGELGYVLEKELANPNENICFSIRAFTDDFRQNGVYKRALRNIVTFDHVNEPGISVAEKWKSPALENLLDMSFSRGVIERSFKEQSLPGFSRESTHLSADELYASLGWSALDSFDTTKKAAYTEW
jgi:hypothetical protein